MFNKSLGRKKFKPLIKPSSKKRRRAPNKSNTVTHPHTKIKDALTPKKIIHFSPQEKDDFDLDFNTFASPENHNENDFSDFSLSPPTDFSLAQNIQSNDINTEINKIP